MADVSNVTGLSELQAMLDTLPVKIEQNILRGALRAGAKVIKDEAAVQLAAHGNVVSGVLAAGLKVSTRARRGNVTASVKAKGKHGYVARWIEFGTAPHVIRGKRGDAVAFGAGVYKLINHPGIRPMPFLRPAMDSKSGAALVAIGHAIKARLTKEGLNASDIEIDEV